MSTPTIPQTDKDREDTVVAGLVRDVPKPRPPKRGGKSHASRAAEQQQHDQPVKSDDATTQPEQPEQPLTEAQQTERNLATFAAQMQALESKRSKPAATKKADAQPDLTAGKRSVERLFYFITEALTAGVPVTVITELYEARREQLDANPNSTTKRVCRELHDLAEHAANPQPSPRSSPSPQPRAEQPASAALPPQLSAALATSSHPVCDAMSDPARRFVIDDRDRDDSVMPYTSSPTRSVHSDPRAAAIQSADRLSGNHDSRVRASGALRRACPECSAAINARCLRLNVQFRAFRARAAPRAHHRSRAVMTFTDPAEGWRWPAAGIPRVSDGRSS